MKQKIGIVTMVGYDNYGNVLQNFAVHAILNELGYDAYTLNNASLRLVSKKSSKFCFYKIAPTYIKRYILTRLRNKFGIKNDRDLTIRGIWNALCQADKLNQVRARRLQEFYLFRTSYLPQDEIAIEHPDFSMKREKEYFAFICGSDTVWSPLYHLDKGNDFLQFANVNKRIALAPSFGVSEVPLEMRGKYCTWLQGIPYLSIREEKGAEIIRELTGKSAEILMDPTIGVSSEEWRQLSVEPVLGQQEDYVLCYFLGNMTDGYAKWIKMYAEKENLKIIEMIDVQNLERYATNPREFLWLIDNAKCVFTDSFHGVIFSVLFHTAFVAFKRVEDGASLMSRMDTLLKTLNLENRVYSLVTLENINNVDFKNSDKIIQYEKNRIKNYLKNALTLIKADEDIGC